MKKVTSILLLLLVLISMVRISVATHFCGGKVVASIISLDGKLADCGMGKNSSSVPVSGTSLASHCCENTLAFCRTDNIYTPSSSFVSLISQSHTEFIFNEYETSSYSYNSLSILHSNNSPPRIICSTDVDLSGICVFRI